MKITTEDVHLLRQIVRWRREMGLDYVHATRHYREPGRGPFVTWDGVLRPEVGFAPSRDGAITWIPVSSVTEAVDVLVTFGFLPARFSSAYREGWDAVVTNMTDVAAFFGKPIPPEVKATAELRYPAHPEMARA